MEKLKLVVIITSLDLSISPAHELPPNKHFPTPKTCVGLIKLISGEGHSVRVQSTTITADGREP